MKRPKKVERASSIFYRIGGSLTNTAEEAIAIAKEQGEQIKVLADDFKEILTIMTDSTKHLKEEAQRAINSYKSELELQRQTSLTDGIE